MLPEAEKPIVNKLRRQILEMAAHAGEGHVPSSLSILDLLYVIYSIYINSIYKY